MSKISKNKGLPAQLGGTPRINLALATLLAVITAYFLWWGLGYTNFNHPLIFALATFFGVFMAFNIGGNDVANSFGTSVGAKTLTIPQALAVAAVFEVSGAVIAGGEVTSTIRSGIVDLNSINIAPMQFVYIMMAALISAAFWLLYATKKGWPVSTTHSIIGGIVGASITLGITISGINDGFNLVQWNKIASIVISWILSPVLGGIVSYIVYAQIKKHILAYNDVASARLKELKKAKQEHKQEHKKLFETLTEVQKLAYTTAMLRDYHIFNENPLDSKDLESDYYKGLSEIEKRKYELNAYKALQIWVPIIAAIGGMIISSMLLFKGLKNMNLGLTTLHNYLIIAMVGSIIWMTTYIFAKSLKKNVKLNRATFLLFSWMQVFTAAGFAFSHGSNDIANAIGPFAAIMDVIKMGDVSSKAAIPTIAMFTFGVALIVGLWFIGKEVIQTVGKNLTKMHPSSGFAAELSAAGVVMMASTFGLPVSSTHILVGAVLGIGLVNKNANWKLMKPIGMAWVITLPAAGIISAISFIILNSIFGVNG